MMPVHTESHPLAGMTIVVADGAFKGEEYRVEDWWDKLTGKSWMFSNVNPACLEYAVRGAQEDTPIDDDVVYGHIGCYGKLIHVSQLPSTEESSS